MRSKKIHFFMLGFMVAFYVLSMSESAWAQYGSGSSSSSACTCQSQSMNWFQAVQTRRIPATLDGGNTAIPFEQKVVDTANQFNLAAGKFKALVSGQYLFNVNMDGLQYTTGQDGSLYARLFVNGISRASVSSPVSASTSANGISLSAIVQLKAGDTVWLGMHGFGRLNEIAFFSLTFSGTKLP